VGDDTPTNDRLDELERDLETTREEAEEHGTIPGKDEPRLSRPDPDDPDQEGMPSPSAF
jgi:hypothetical protein